MQLPSGYAETDYRLIFQSLPGYFILISPQHTILAVSNRFKQALALPEQDLINQPVTAICSYFYPDAETTTYYQEWEYSLNQVLSQRQPHTMAVQSLAFNQTDAQEPSYWQGINSPVLSASGEVAYIIYEARDITQEYLLALQTKKTEERFAAIALATNDAVWDWDLRNNTVIWNESYKTLFGFTQIDTNAASWHDFIHPEDQERVYQGITQVIESGGKFWSDEYRFQCADGSYSEIMDRGYVLHDEAGVPYRMVGSMQDITLYKKTEQQLKETSDFFQFLADTVPAFIWTSHPDGTTDYRNAYYLNFVSRSLASRPGFHWSELLPPEERETIAAEWQSNLAAGLYFEKELRIRNAAGEYRWVLARANPKQDAEGNIVKWLGTATDIHSQKMTQLALEESYQRFKFLADMVPALIWTSNPDGTTDYRNQNYYQYIGDESANRPDFDWTIPLHPDDRTETYTRWMQSASTGQPFEIEHRLWHYSGEYRWLISRATPMRNQNGQVLKWFGTSTDIHEQKLFQQELQDRETWLQRLLADAPVMFCVLRGPELVCTFLNPQMERLYGNRALVGLPARNAWPEIANQGFLEEINTVYNTGQSFAANEYPLNINTGSAAPFTTGYFNISVQPLRDVNQQVEGVLCFSVEVTGQVIAKNQAEALAAKLQHETEKFKLLSEAVPQLVWTSRPDGIIDYLNQQWINYTGIPWQEGQDSGLLEVLHPDDYTFTMQHWLDRLSTGQPLELEYRLRNAAGQYRWHLARGLALKDVAGNIVKWCGTCTDIHDQKDIQRKLQESNERFRFLAEAIPQKVWTAKPNGEVDYFNQQWLQYTGLKMEELTEWGWQRVMHPDDLPHTLQAWKNSLATATDFQTENRLRRADGTYRWQLTRGLPMHNQWGLITMWVGTITDIHDQKTAQENLQEANSELKRINEDLDRFVYTASHDLKLPIINMGGLFEEIIKSGAFTDPDHAKLVQLFYKSLDQINTTITDLSEIAKVQKNIHAEKEKIDLAALTEEICLSIQDQIQSSGAQINTDFAAVPHLEFSKANLRSILYNLISNAIKYRSPELVPAVLVKTSIGPDHVILSVQDNGLGINLDLHKEKLFQMFKRFHSHVPGTGLGLYMINRIMQNNNGHVEVESKIKEGSTFRVYFRKP
ncbi:PAS domain-containing protein [Adhaeribacter rhizoryzae]|uniref:histidine kinase n=1 Tax=Adhaeribacter rhizoryzae TaxID=2607907 RepID=A0A5M6DNX9_9BACT|nr:PAS domain-containing protein [Adhaeribacter rhizoryzae]KAA5549194.1 PAS domain-containing protein [Adhaeribacter rhizoryzae]